MNAAKLVQTLLSGRRRSATIVLICVSSVIIIGEFSAFWQGGTLEMKTKYTGIMEV